MHILDAGWGSPLEYGRLPTSLGPVASLIQHPDDALVGVVAASQSQGVWQLITQGHTVLAGQVIAARGNGGALPRPDSSPDRW